MKFQKPRILTENNYPDIDLSQPVLFKKMINEVVEDSKSANCIREIREIIINTCQSDPNPVTVNSSQYIFYKLLHW